MTEDLSELNNAPTVPHTRARIADAIDSVINFAHVAWVFPTLARGYYWQPNLREFTKLFPNSLVLTGYWPGEVAGSQGSIEVRLLSGARTLVLKRHSSGYDTEMTFLLPFSIMWQLWRFRPKVIITEQFGLLTLYTLLLKKLIGARVVFFCEGISPGIAALKQPFRLAIRRLMGRGLDACICNTRESAEYLRDIIGIPQEKIVHEPFLVPEIATLCAGRDCIPYLASRPKPVFLYVGSLSERKGVRQLMQAVAELRCRNALFSLVLVGEGELRSELESFIAIHHLDDLVTLAGQVSYEDLGAYYRACDVFVFPTLEDIWGMVVPEAMAFGKMVLCSHGAGARELVQQGKCGWLFDPLDSHELSECMLSIIQQPTLAQEFGALSLDLMAQYGPRRVAQLFATISSSGM